MSCGERIVRNCGEGVWGLMLQILGLETTEVRVVGEGLWDVITTRESMSQEAGAADFGPEDLAAAAPATTCNGVGQHTKPPLCQRREYMMPIQESGGCW